MGRDLLKTISQLRMYTIKEGKMAEWVDGWTRGVLPLRRKFGFRVDGAWVVPEGNRFIWILSYDGPDGFEARDSAYYVSSDRKSMKPDPAPLIEKAESWFVTAAIEQPREE